MRRVATRRRGITTALPVVAAVVLVPVVVAAVALVVTIPPPVDDFHPEPWNPPAALETDRARPGPVELEPASVALDGPEDIAVDSLGRRYTGDRGGTIWRTGADGRAERFADVGGRPLGLAFAPDRDLLVANHGIGLQAVAPDGTVTLLADRAAGVPIRFANDLDVAVDGVVHLTDSSLRYNTTTLGPDALSYLLPDLVDGRASGRLLRHDLASGRTTVVRDGLHFPNGVLAAGRRIWVAESTRYRITAIDPASGAPSVVVDGLPGVPDNLNRDVDGSMLVALTDRAAALDGLVLPTAFGREVLARLPAEWLLSRDRPPRGSILTLDTAGAVVAHHRGITPAPTSVVPVEGGWVVGALLQQPLRGIRR